MVGHPELYAAGEPRPATARVTTSTLVTLIAGLLVVLLGLAWVAMTRSDSGNDSSPTATSETVEQQD